MGQTRSMMVVALSLSLPALAHDADVVYAALGDGADGALVETVTLTGNALALLAPIDADRDGTLTQADLDRSAAAIRAGVWDEAPLTAGASACVRSAERALVREGFVELDATFTCGEGELQQDFRFLRVLPTNYRVVLGSQVEGEQGRAFAQGSFTSVRVPRPGVRALAPMDTGAALAEGAQNALRLDVLAVMVGLFLLWGARPRESAVVWLGFVITALIGGLISLPDTFRSATLSVLLGASIALRSREWALVGAILLAGVVALPEPALGMADASFAVNFGTAAVLLVVAAVTMAASRRLDARPDLRLRLAQVCLALALFGLGFRLSGRLSS